MIRPQVLGILVLTGCWTLMAQESGSITGQILDPAGAVISRAKVDAKNEATAAVFSTLSDDTGFYRAPQLRPGIYTITASIAGFRTSVRPGVEVRIDDRLRVDFQLEVGAVTESLTVQGQAALLQTEGATAGQVIDTNKIVDLPLNSRNWLQLATLAAGTVSYPGSVDTSAGNSQNVVMNVGGMHTNQGNWLLDGTDNTNFVSAGAVAYPPVDSLQEFKVETNNYSADTGRLGGAVINATIRSGSNNFHGTAYDFLRNRELNARNFFANPTANKPEFTRNQYGASLGGPFIKDKLLFFLNYEGNRQRQDQIVTRQVFTDAQKAGDFSSQLGSQIAVDALGRPVLQGQIFDPFSVSRAANGTMVRDPFPGNIIPANRINPVASALINLVPGPNTTGNPNFIRDLSNPLNIDTFAGRVDWLRSAENTVFGHFIYSDQNSSTAAALGLPIDGGGFNLLSNQRQLAIGWTHVFSPSSLNDFRIGYLRNHRLTQELQANQDLNAKYGIPFPYPGDGLGGLATIAITGYTSLGSNGGTFPQFVNKYELSDGYTLIRGRHSMKFGFQGEVKTFENRQACNSCRGALTFNGLYTQQPGFAGTGSAVADFLTGVANDATLANVRSEKDVGKDYDFYAQDKWLVTPKLTISLGLRYQLHPPMFEAHDALSNVLFGPQVGSGQLVVPQGMNDTTFNFLKNTLMPYIPVSKTSDLGRGLVRTNYLNFAPRLGIAWQITPKTVLRTGYGIFYGFPDQTSSAVLSISPPGNLSITTSSNQIDPTLLLNQSIFGANPFNRPLTNPSFFAIFDPNMHAEVIQMYNLSVQHQFGSSWVAEVGYMGNRGSHLLFFNNINDAFPAVPSDTSTPQSRRRVSTVLGNLSYYAPQGYSNYNAMTLSLEKRFTQGFTLLASYTWSRALGVDPASILGVNSTAIVNPFDLKREYGPLEFDVINRGVISYSYELPVGRGKRYLSSVPKALDEILGGWQVSGITTLQGGLPITPVLGVSLGKTFTNSRPDVVGDPTASARQPNAWLNKNAFAIPSSSQIAAGDFYGNTGRGSVRAPGLVNLDFSVMKNFQVGENRRLQFRCELFNLMNTPFFGGDGYVNVNVSSPTFGQITQAGDPRVIQLGLKFIF